MIRKYFDKDLSSYPESLQGYLLISETFIFNQEFVQSVILVLEHNKDVGAIGVALNQKSHMKLERFVHHPPPFSITVGKGGFINPQNLLYIHSKPNNKEMESSDSRTIMDDLYFNHYTRERHQNFIALLDLEKKKQVQVRLLSGYVSWSPLQLDNEIENGVWMLLRASKNIIFDIKFDKMWEYSIKQKGGLYKSFINYGKDPMLN